MDLTRLRIVPVILPWNEIIFSSPGLTVSPELSFERLKGEVNTKVALLIRFAEVLMDPSTR